MTNTLSVFIVKAVLTRREDTVQRGVSVIKVVPCKQIVTKSYLIYIRKPLLPVRVLFQTALLSVDNQLFPAVPP